MSRKSWRSRHLLILMVVLALFAAACGDAGEGTTTTAANGGDEDPLGVWEIAEGEKIQIRALQSQTGDAGPLGIDQIRGVQLAIQDFGPVNGFEVDLGQPEDDLCSSEGGQSGLQAIVAQENVIAVIGVLKQTRESQPPEAQQRIDSILKKLESSEKK